MPFSAARPPAARPPGARPIGCRGRLVVALLVVGTVLAVPAGTSAAAPACPESPERLAVTWGFAPEHMRTVTRLRGGLGLDAPAPQRRTGLGSGRRSEVRTVRDRGGVGRPVVCTDRRWRVALPRIGRRELVGAASANGAFVAWRVARVGRPGRVFVGEVSGGRLRAVRRTETVVGRRGRLVNGNFVVAEDGTAAWTIAGGDAPGHGAVWPRDAEPTRFRLERRRQAGVWVLDDQNVLVSRQDPSGWGPENEDLLVDGGRRRYRPPVPGVCPRRYGAPSEDLGGWETATAGRTGFNSGTSMGSIAWHTTCDPVTGDYVEITTADSFGNQYVTGRTTIGAQARVGRWLLQERVGSGERRGTTVRITDAVDRRSRLAAGALDVDGVLHPPPGTVPFASAEAPWSAGVVAAPGVIAWIQRDDPDRPGSWSTLWLADGAGTRAIRRAASIDALDLTEGALTWTADGVRASVAARPVAGESFAVRPRPAG